LFGGWGVSMHEAQNYIIKTKKTEKNYTQLGWGGGGLSILLGNTRISRRLLERKTA